MLRRVAFTAWEAAASNTSQVVVGQAIGSAIDQIVAPFLDEQNEIGRRTLGTTSTSYSVTQPEGFSEGPFAGASAGASARRWKQTWQKDLGQRRAQSGKASDGEADQQKGDATTAQNDVFTASPESLALPPSSPLFKRESTPGGWRQLGLRIMGYYTQESQVARGSTALFERITVQVQDERFYKALNLPLSFRTSYSLLVLHVWMCLVRLRKDGPERGAPVGQLLYDLFQHDVEKRVVNAGVTMSASSYLRDLEKNFYGAASAYDTAVAPSAARSELPQALWRNVLAEQGEPRELPAGPRTQDAENLARYVRRELASLDLTDSDSFLAGNIKFHNNFN